MLLLSLNTLRLGPSALKGETLNTPSMLQSVSISVKFSGFSEVSSFQSPKSPGSVTTEPEKSGNLNFQWPLANFFDYFHHHRIPSPSSCSVRSSKWISTLGTNIPTPITRFFKLSNGLKIGPAPTPWKAAPNWSWGAAVLVHNLHAGITFSGKWTSNQCDGYR